MAKKELFNNELHPYLVVGSGLGGVHTFFSLPDEIKNQCLVLESEAQPGGRCASGLHSVCGNLKIDHIESEFGPSHKVGVYFDKKYAQLEEFDWSVLPEVQKLRQWQDYTLPQKFVSNLKLPEIPSEQVHYSCPVIELRYENQEWIVSTPKGKLRCENLVWSAGVLAFFNAYGKKAAQKLFVANPEYNETSSDFLGGLSFEWTLNEALEETDFLPEQNIFLIRIKHSKKSYMSFVYVEENRSTIQTLSYLPNEILNSPKEILSFQKSLKRSLKYCFNSEKSLGGKEHWVVDGTLRGYAYGSPWSVKNKAEIGFFYVGESSESALKQKLSGLEAVLISSKNAVESLTSRPESQKSSEKSKITPDLSL